MSVCCCSLLFDQFVSQSVAVVYYLVTLIQSVAVVYYWITLCHSPFLWFTIGLLCVSLLL